MVFNYLFYKCESYACARVVLPFMKPVEDHKTLFRILLLETNAIILEGNMMIFILVFKLGVLPDLPDGRFFLPRC